jgi:hypothetical protein
MGMAYPHGDPKDVWPVTAPTKTLAMPLRATTDAYITCIVCREDHVEFEFWSRTPDSKQFQGLHRRCAETIGVISNVVRQTK